MSVEEKRTKYFFKYLTNNPTCCRYPNPSRKLDTRNSDNMDIILMDTVFNIVSDPT
jgi:hypothetical protein